MRIYDISQPLTNDTVVWPGDPPVRLSFTAEQANGDSVFVPLLQYLPLPSR